MPPLIFASTILRSSQALLLWGPGGAVLGRENDVAVAAKNFLVGIPGETLRTDIPADHLARQILREHGEVGRALNYQSKQVSISGSSGFRNLVQHYWPSKLPAKGLNTKCRGKFRLALRFFRPTLSAA